MTDPFDTSSISDDPAYWDALAERVTRTAVRRPVAAEWLSRGSTPWLVATSLACAASLIFALIADRGLQPQRTGNADWMAVLAPHDAIGRSFASSESAPPIGELLAVTAAEVRR